MQAETSVEISINSQSSNQSKSENSSTNSEANDEISIQNDGPSSTPKTQQEQPEQLFITSNYTFSTLALIFIAIAMSTVVLMTSGSRKTVHSLIELEDLFEDDSDESSDNKVTTESYGDVNSSYINPERAKFEYIHGQLKDLSICLVLFNISDLNGACLVHNPKDFFDASDACVTHNMTLLEINSDHEKSRVYEETEKIFGTGGGTRIWMNGKYSPKEDAFLSHPKFVKFFITNDQIEGNGQKYRDGECLAIESWYKGRYHISSVPCGGAHYFYCEF